MRGDANGGLRVRELCDRFTPFPPYRHTPITSFPQPPEAPGGAGHRVTHRVHIIETNAESYRLRDAKKRAQILRRSHKIFPSVT